MTQMTAHSNAQGASQASTQDSTLHKLAGIIESRKLANGGNPDTSYVSRLLAKAPDAFLKKIGEEATEVVMAAKDLQASPSEAGKALLVGEVADLWFHSMVALAHFDLQPSDVLAELSRREGLSGLEEKALRKAQARDAQAQEDKHGH
jgi:phosphoribosyl-ATP pyrophosphohydrolase